MLLFRSGVQQVQRPCQQGTDSELDCLRGQDPAVRAEALPGGEWHPVRVPEPNILWGGAQPV